jgi:GNAT superfamily N-acetyltransferase
MANDLIIREAGMADAQALFEAHQDSVQNLCAGAYSEEQLAVWFEDRSPEIYRPAIEAHQIWLAEQSGRVLGFVGFAPGEVTLLFVRKEAAGLGLGTRLFAFGLAKAESGFSGPLTVVATQNSQRFYQSHGFAPVERDALVRGKAQIQIKVVKMQRVLAAVS